MPEQAGKVVTFAHADDWVGMYVNGNLVYSGHSMNPSMVLDQIGIEHRHREYTPEQMEDMGLDFPATWEELPDAEEW